MPLQRGDNFDTEFVKTDEYCVYRAAAFKGVCALTILMSILCRFHCNAWMPDFVHRRDGRNHVTRSSHWRKNG